jgi:predicted glycosyltransferase
MQMLTLPPTVVQDQRRGDRIRFLLYCHDTFGLGHLRRVLSLAKYFTDTLPNAEVLIVTGSPMAHAFVLPPRTDYVKLPAVTKMRDGGYRARDLDLELAAIRDLRATILRDTAQSYRPDVFLADHAPQGFQGEVLPTLKLLRDTQPDCLRVVGLRDIVDASTTVRQRWHDEGVYQTLEEDYDLILVYGSQYLYDIAAEYALPANVAGRVRYCGYLNRLPDPRPSNDSIHAEHSTTERLVVLTAGGGGDGFPLMRAYLSGLQQLPSIPFSSVILTGPLMDKDDEQELHKLQAGLPVGRVRVDKFLADPLPLLRAADLVVAMAGYNTTCELLALQQRMLLVPRSTPRQEQLIRASLLAQRGLAQVLTMEELTPARLIDSILQSFAKPRPERRQLDKAGISFQGQALARQAILDERDRLSAPMWIGDRVMAQAA